MRLSPILRFCSWLAVLASLLSPAGPAMPAAFAADAPVVVTLRDVARVTSESVTLGQIATISGREAIRVLLAQIVVLPGLSAGASVRLAASQVRAAIAEAGFDARAIAIVGPGSIRIDRPIPVAAGRDPEGARSSPRGETLVRRGATVRVIAMVAAVRVTTTGVALAAGAAGDVIPVRVTTSRREVSAVVVERGVVAVQL